MKILDKYLLRQFISTFLTVFVILFFIFILQTVWLFISELAGKDLDFISVLKFLLFATPRIVPLVLPLSVLLASIMTFGNLAENYELAAMKSSGVSLKRALKYLTFFILLLSVVAFFFANNVIPYAEYKFINFRRNIAQVKPAMAIAEGQFSQVGNYSIKVDKKSGDNGRFLDGVTIHKKNGFESIGTTIIKAKKGELVSSESSNNLMMVLRDGNYYEEIIPKKYEERNKLPFAKSEFKRYVINIDLSKLNKVDENEEQITNTNSMLTIGELKYTIDSLNKNYKKDLSSYIDNINARVNSSFSNAKNNQNLNNTAKLNNNDLLSNFNTSEKQQMLRVASGVVESNNFSIESSKYEFQAKTKNINSHWISFFEKFAIAFSCILMFFIGAPLGAIIRKGGLGLPIVFAVMIFIVYHFINTFGKKLAQEDGISPFLGAWMATLVLLPLAIFFTKRATDDRGVALEFSWLDYIIDKYFPKKEEDNLIDIPVNSIEKENNEQYIQDEKVENKHESVPVQTEESQPVDFKKDNYRLFSILALVANVVSITTLFLFDVTNLTKTLAIIAVLCLLILVFFSQKIVSKNLKSYDLPIWIVLLGAFPFYIFFFVYNFYKLKKLTQQHHDFG